VRKYCCEFIGTYSLVFFAAGANLPNEALGVTPFVAFCIELFLSFLLMWVICGAAFFAPESMKSLGGVAVGAVVGIEVMLMGSYLAMGDFTHYWIYVVGPIAGMILGALVYRFTHNLAPG
jgi:glycerol uptake facilitator-like aquaporin